jgi:hypothetical protein
MKIKLMVYLEEYARFLDKEMENCLDQSGQDHDRDAAQEAGELRIKVRNIRRLVSFLSVQERLIRGGKR